MRDNHSSKDAQKLDPKIYHHKAQLGFGIFILFFLYYVGCAIIQTPKFQHIASISFVGLPLGFFLSLGIFPVSLILLFIFFIFWR